LDFKSTLKTNISEEIADDGNEKVKHALNAFSIIAEGDFIYGSVWLKSSLQLKTYTRPRHNLGFYLNQRTNIDKSVMQMFAFGKHRAARLHNNIALYQRWTAISCAKSKYMIHFRLLGNEYILHEPDENILKFSRNSS
jgi:hypothetical protein